MVNGVFPVEYRLIMIILHAQKKSISRPMTMRSPGKNCSSPNGHTVLCAHCPEENQVSNVSGSCVHHSPGDWVWTLTWSSLYQAGIWCPHQICRLMHQSWRFSIQLKKVFSKCFGTILMSPLFTAWIAARFIENFGWSVLSHHCFDMRGSTMCPHRSWRAILLL